MIETAATTVPNQDGFRLVTRTSVELFVVDPEHTKKTPEDRIIFVWNDMVRERQTNHRHWSKTKRSLGSNSQRRR